MNRAIATALALTAVDLTAAAETPDNAVENPFFGVDDFFSSAQSLRSLGAQIDKRQIVQFQSSTPTANPEEVVIAVGARLLYNGQPTGTRPELDAVGSLLSQCYFHHARGTRHRYEPLGGAVGSLWDGVAVSNAFPPNYVGANTDPVVYSALGLPPRRATPFVRFGKPIAMAFDEDTVEVVSDAAGVAVAGDHVFQGVIEFIGLAIRKSAAGDVIAAVEANNDCKGGGKLPAEVEAEANRILKLRQRFHDVARLRR